MFERLVLAITDLPVIVQGAMGSAVFASFLFLAQKILMAIGTQYANSSARRKRQALIDELATLEVNLAERLDTKTYYTIIVIYRSSRYVIRGLIWLSLGLVFSSSISVFGIVGYLWGTYHLLQALRIVQGVNDAQDRLKRRDEIRSKLSAVSEKDSDKPTHKS
jgi:hypothetical protein